MSRADYNTSRKKLTHHHFIRGNKQEITGENEVKIENSAGVPFKKIEVTGNTKVEIKNQALDYTEYLSTLENYTKGSVSGTYAIKLPEAWQGKELSYALKETTALSGVDLYLATSGDFSTANTLPLIENGTVTEQAVKDYTHLIFKGIVDEEIEDEEGNISTTPTDITTFWQGHTLIVTSAICPEFSATIKNANEEGTQLFVRSHNLINLKDGGGTRTDSDGNVFSWEIKDGIVTINGISNAFFVLSLDYKNYGVVSYEAGTYSYTTGYYRGENSINGGCDWKFSYSASEKQTGWTNATTRVIETNSFYKPFQIQHCQLYINANVQYNNRRYAPALFKGAYKSVDKLPPFEPYFKRVLEVPSTVELDGKTVDLPFTIYDRLLVDGARKKVIYEKRSGVKSFKGTESFSVGTFNNDLFAYKIELSRLGFKESTGSGYCSHFVPKPRSELEKRGDACFEYSSFGEGCVCFLYDTLGYSYSDMLLAKNDFRAWLGGQYEAGTPVTIVAQYKEAEEIDITSTDFGKALLNLCMEKGKNGYLCLKSDPTVTSLVCEYYSQEAEDKVVLTVSYKDASGTKIAEDDEYQVRKGSYYQISVPHIDGYIRTKTELFGTSDTDTTIDLIYMEE